MKRRWSRALAALAGITAAAAPQIADACSTYEGGHYYAIIQKLDATNAANGAAIQIFTNSLTAANSTSFVNHEMWYGVNGNGSYWVEVGFKDGSTCRSATSAYDPQYDCSSIAPVHQAVFWADQRANGGGYHEHYPSYKWLQDAYYEVQVDWAGVSCAWNVYVGVSYVGTSTANCAGPTRYLAAGIESTNAAATQHVGGYLTEWEEKHSNNAWAAGWEGAALYATCPADIRNYGNYTNEVLHGPI
jgi:hypothetical protein